MRSGILCALLLAAACGPGTGTPDGGATGSSGGTTGTTGSSGGSTGGGTTGASSTGASSTGGTTGGTSTGGFQQAAHDPFPRIPNGGGPVVAHPQLVTVTFPGLAIAAQARSYDTWLASSSWLAQVGADYGVGNGPAPLEADLDGGPPPWAGSSDVAAFLAASFDGGALPPPDGGQIYVLYLPPDAPFAGLCNTVLGFHDDGFYDGQPFAYAVVPDCSATVTGYPDPESFELVASHEVIEAATNPYFDGDGGTLAWQLTDPTNPWWAPGFGEVADVCEGQIWQDPTSGAYAQRAWSNTQAALGTGSPCLPTPAAPYFNVSPSPATPLSIPAGGSQTIQLTGWATADVPPWDLTEMAVFGDFDPAPAFADAGIANGVTQDVVLSVPAGTPPGARTQVWIGSYAPGASDYTSFWPVAVESR